MLFDDRSKLVDEERAEVEKRAFSIEEVSFATSLSKPFLRNKIRDGSLRATRFGRRVLVLKEDLDSFLNTGS